MDYETYGAACPLCSNPVLIKVTPNSIGSFEFDACPHCGFIEFVDGEVRTEEDTTKEKRINAWHSILEHHHVNTLAELAEYVKELSPDPEFNKTVFEYSSYSAQQLSRCIVTQEDIDASKHAVKKKIALSEAHENSRRLVVFDDKTVLLVGSETRFSSRAFWEVNKLISVVGEDGFTLDNALDELKAREPLYTDDELSELGESGIEITRKVKENWLKEIRFLEERK